MIGAVTLAVKLAEQTPIPTGVGVKTPVPTQNRERVGRVKIAERLKRGVDRRGVLAVAGLVRPVSAMETKRHSRIKPPVQGICLATLR